MGPTTTVHTDTSRPLQVIPYKEKTKDWYKANADYYISQSTFLNSPTSTREGRDLDVLYGVYNNQFPLPWFEHITNPLNSTKDQFKTFPAKIRPVSILRTNIDLMLSEYPRRPFIYQVENLGDTGYNRYMEGMKEQAKGALTTHFLQSAVEDMIEAGEEVNEEMMARLQEDPPVPEQIKQQFHSSFRDLIAIKGQKWLKRTIREVELRRKLHKMFKHWLIAGEVRSYKGIQNDKLVYRDISPKNLAYDKDEAEEFIEDGSWVVHRELRSISAIVDQFYDDLSEKELKEMEQRPDWLSSARTFYSEMIGRYGETGRVPLYHCQWKGKKKQGLLSVLDPETFQLEESEVDEDYVLDRERGEQVEWRWVNEVYEVWRIGEDLFPVYGPLEVQRGEMNNISACKLSYNGRNYSDLHSTNISLLEMGLPFQILYIIITYTLEKTIAKSKGKILLIDQNAIPDDDDWDEEKFFYYAEALGYGLLNRNQIGVDKTWNQYQVLDMSLFDQIKQLIEIQQHLKTEWDDITGVNRQRKGQTMASDGVGSNERATFQSTVMTDMLFIPFEEFAEREMQGLLDLSKFLTARGVYGTYNDDEMGIQLMEIMPEDFQNEALGVFVQRSSETMEKLKEMRSYAQAMLQNDHKGSTVLEIIDTDNVAELKQKLKRIEEIDASIQAQIQDKEQLNAVELEDLKKEYAEYQSMLDVRELHVLWDRKDENEMIKGSFNTFSFQDGDSNDNGIPDATEVMKLQQSGFKIAQEVDRKMKEHNAKNAERLQKQDLSIKEFNETIKMNKHQREMDKKKLAQGDKKLAIDKKKAAQRPKPAAKK